MRYMALGVLLSRASCNWALTRYIRSNALPCLALPYLTSATAGLLSTRSRSHGKGN